MESKNQSKPALRPYTKGELAAIYNISPHIFRVWMKAHPELQHSKGQRIFNVKEVQKIFETFGIPQSFQSDNEK
jgi:hypothetical protein